GLKQPPAGVRRRRPALSRPNPRAVTLVHPKYSDGLGKQATSSAFPPNPQLTRLHGAFAAIVVRAVCHHRRRTWLLLYRQPCLCLPFGHRHLVYGTATAHNSIDYVERFGTIAREPMVRKMTVYTALRQQLGLTLCREG